MLSHWILFFLLEQQRGSSRLCFQASGSWWGPSAHLALTGSLSLGCQSCVSFACCHYLSPNIDITVGISIMKSVSGLNRCRRLESRHSPPPAPLQQQPPPPGSWARGGGEGDAPPPRGRAGARRQEKTRPRLLPARSVVARPPGLAPCAPAALVRRSARRRRFVCTGPAAVWWLARGS